MMIQSTVLKSALRRWPRSSAAALHFGLSLFFAALVATIIFALWFPGEYRTFAGGAKLFWLIVSVDVVMGPLLTFVVFNLAKPRRELVRDLSIICLMQLAALGYGLYTLHEARPVALVFEFDRFRVVLKANVLESELPRAKAEYQSLPLNGPWLLGTREIGPGDEKLQSVDLALQGFDIGQRPTYWQAYDVSREKVLKQSRPVTVLLEKYSSARSDIENRLQQLGLSADTARFLPVNPLRDLDWVVLLKPNGDVAGFAPYDGFF
jgi:hypothetical protein